MTLRKAEIVTRGEAIELEVVIKVGQIHATFSRSLSVYRSVGPSLALSRSAQEETGRHAA
jgi:hypothetical protein